MAVRIEILRSDTDSADLAFYHVITSVLPAANDPTRVAAGTRLSAPELASLRSGALYETLLSISIKGMSTAAARTRIEALWQQAEAPALAEYAARYRFAHFAWDGTSWS